MPPALSDGVDGVASQEKGKNPWPAVQAELVVSADGVASYKGLPLKTSAGNVTCTISGGSIS